MYESEGVATKQVHINDTPVCNTFFKEKMSCSGMYSHGLINVEMIIYDASVCVMCVCVCFTVCVCVCV